MSRCVLVQEGVLWLHGGSRAAIDGRWRGMLVLRGVFDGEREHDER